MSEAVPPRLAGTWMWGLVAGFAAVSVLGMLNHEPWRDEAQAWLIARDCPDLGCVLRIAGYEGHPALWHLILMPLARAGLPFMSAAVAHFLIALAAVVLFLRHAPFTPLQKALFVFGYYLLYEYNILVRNYAVCFLLLFALAALYRARFRRPVAYAALLSLMANTSLFGLLIALVLAAAYGLERRRSGLPAAGRRWACALLLAGAGFGLTLCQLWPPADVLPPRAHSGPIRESLLDLRFSLGHLSLIPRSLVGAFLPLPQAGPQFWNSQLAYHPLEGSGLLKDMPAVVRWAYGILLVCPALLSLAVLARKTVPFLVYLLASCALLGVFLVIYVAGARHHGFIFILFIFALWISDAHADNRLAGRKAFQTWFGAANAGRLLSGLLAVHVAAAAAAFYHELKYDFSSGRNAALFLKQEGLLGERVFIATYPSKSAGSILLHTEAAPSAVYLVEYERPGSYMVWNREYMYNRVLAAETVMERIDRAIAGQDYERVVLITDSTTAAAGYAGRYRLLAFFPETVARQESFCIYELERPPRQDAQGPSRRP